VGFLENVFAIAFLHIPTLLYTIENKKHFVKRLCINVGCIHFGSNHRGDFKIEIYLIFLKET
jgi:hypothetical protein